MKVIAVLMVKDEVDILRYTLLHLLDEVDEIVVADNLSADGTRDLLNDLEREYSRTIRIVDDPDPAYYQSKKMSALAALVSQDQPEPPWILPVDADELWYWPGDRISEELRRLENIEIVTAPLYNHFGSSIDVIDDNPFKRIVYRQREPGALPKVAFRWQPGAVIEQGNHGVSMTGRTLAFPGLALRHFPYRSAEQFVHKAVVGAEAYKATDLPSSQGAHWREYGALYERHGAAALIEVYERWFYFPAPVTAGLVLDPAPYRRWFHGDLRDDGDAE